MKMSHDVMYCPRSDCCALIALDEVKKSALSLNGPFGCPKCQQALCYQCKSEWHAGIGCKQYQYMKSKAQDAITQYCRDMNWMQCFECGHVIEKRAGCNHIACLCGAQFCYLCGTKWGDCRCQVISNEHALRHNRVPGSGEEYICHDCRQPFPSRRELTVHINVCRTRLERLGGAYECASCLSRFQSTEMLRNHRRTCVAVKKGIYACPHCKFECDEQATLRRHNRMCGDTAVVAGC